MGIIVYDEIEDGRYKFKDKSYDVILELEGESISETRRNTNCNECENNVYAKEANIHNSKGRLWRITKKNWKIFRKHKTNFKYKISK